MCLMAVALLPCRIWAQDDEVLRAARYLSGASSEEDVDEYWVSRLEARQGSPVRINSVHPRSDGLLTDYQLASLADYRSTSGDILSWEELSLVDGFSREWVKVMRPFLSLSSSRAPGAADTSRVHMTGLVRGTLSGIGAKAKLSADSWCLAGAIRGRDGTFSGEYAWRGFRAVAGDYNLRLGQGLAHWSGFSMESISSVDGFIRRTGGISPVWSYSSALVHRGGALEYTTAHFRGSLFGAADIWGAHADWLGRHGQVGVSALYEPKQNGRWTIALDSRWNWKGSDWVGEIAYRNRTFSGKVAWRRSFGPFKLAVQGRLIPSRYAEYKYGEYALAAGASFRSEHWRSLAGKSGFGSSVPVHQISLTLDSAMLPIPETDPGRLQIRACAGWQWQFSSAWSLDLRLTERHRNYEYSRTDIRADLRYGNGPWMAAFRAEGVHCESFGFLNYLEGGYKESRFSGYVRLTGFVIDRWNDRIYCYERDAAGTFSVPAYSGRGGIASVVGSWKHRFRHFSLKANLRAAWMARMGRAPTPSLNLQIQSDLFLPHF